MSHSKLLSARIPQLAAIAVFAFALGSATIISAAPPGSIELFRLVDRTVDTQMAAVNTDGSLLVHPTQTTIEASAQTVLLPVGGFGDVLGSISNGSAYSKVRIYVRRNDCNGGDLIGGVGVSGGPDNTYITLDQFTLGCGQQLSRLYEAPGGGTILLSAQAGSTGSGTTSVTARIYVVR